MPRTPAALICGIALLFNLADVRSEAISELVVFGDSLSDAGNDLAILRIPQPPYWNGRFADGPTWVGHLAGNLGISVPSASETGGTNYAYGGAETGFGSSWRHPAIPNMGVQINDYLGDGNIPASDQLFIVFGGHNDLAEGPGIHDASEIVGNINNHISTLATAGATRFLIPNLMPLGTIPPEVGTPDEATHNQLSMDVNALLIPELEQLRNSLGITIYELDTFAVFMDVLSNPAIYGFTNTTQRAFTGGYDGTGTLVPNPSEYVYFDDIHPTTAMHAVLGQAAMAAIPEPATPLILAGLGLTLFIRRRRQRCRGMSESHRAPDTCGSGISCPPAAPAPWTAG